jgi:rhodanese-related sulfurtransferase/rubrerythrin
MENTKKSSRVESMFPDDAREYMDEHKEGSYTLLDVRQPAEYEEAHLPGAKLVPLPQLADSLQELNTENPLIVYCAMGVRSLTAAELLSHQGFREVYNLVGGIEAWEDRPAEGPVGFHLKLIRGDETPEEILTLAYQMEEGLRNFHQMVKDKTTDSEVADLLTHLIRAEESHKRRVLELRSQYGLSPEEDSGEGTSSDSTWMEGGFNASEFMKKNEHLLGTVLGVLNVAMMIETQALDLYLQMANESANENTKKVLFQIAGEEKGHLAALGRLLEEKLGSS